MQNLKAKFKEFTEKLEALRIKIKEIESVRNNYPMFYINQTEDAAVEFVNQDEETPEMVANLLTELRKQRKRRQDFNTMHAAYMVAKKECQTQIDIVNKELADINKQVFDYLSQTESCNNLV